MVLAGNIRSYAAMDQANWSLGIAMLATILARPQVMDGSSSKLGSIFRESVRFLPVSAPTQTK